MTGNAVKFDDWKGPTTPAGKKALEADKAAKAKNPKKGRAKWPSEGSSGDEITITVTYAYYKQDGDDDCVIQWYEFTNFRSTEERDHGMKADEWVDYTARDDIQLDSLIDWNARSQPTAGDKECDEKARTTTLYDAAFLGKEHEILYERFIAVYAYSGADCKCGGIAQNKVVFMAQVIDKRAEADLPAAGRKRRESQTWALRCPPHSLRRLSLPEAQE
jgi:hypothetical protein